MFVSADDFSTLPYKLPGLNNPGASADFSTFVSDQEDEWLRKLVGNLFYDALITGVGALPGAWVSTTSYIIDNEVTYQSAVWKSLSGPNLNHVPVEGADWTKVVNPAVDRWLKLRDGENYQVATIQNCPTFQWVGMERMVQPMIYSLWFKNSTRSNSGQGVVVSANENSELVSPGLEISRSWRAYNKIAAGYRVVTYLSRLYSYSVANTFFGYLVAKSADFDDVITDGSYDTFLSYVLNQFCRPGSMNEFDI